MESISAAHVDFYFNALGDLQEQIDATYETSSGHQLKSDPLPLQAEIMSWLLICKDISGDFWVLKFTPDENNAYELSPRLSTLCDWEAPETVHFIGDSAQLSEWLDVHGIESYKFRLSSNRHQTDKFKKLIRHC